MHGATSSESADNVFDVGNVHDTRSNQFQESIDATREQLELSIEQHRTLNPGSISNCSHQTLVYVVGNPSLAVSVEYRPRPKRLRSVSVCTGFPATVNVRRRWFNVARRDDVNWSPEGALNLRSLTCIIANELEHSLNFGHVRLAYVDESQV
jgi:hypothetical protein